MANKKYIDFPEGVYNPGKIFLQADPLTGKLEKINLPVIAKRKYLIVNFIIEGSGIIDFQVLATSVDFTISSVEYYSVGQYFFHFSDNIPFEANKVCISVINTQSATTFLYNYEIGNDYIYFQQVKYLNGEVSDTGPLFTLLIDFLQ